MKLAEDGNKAWFVGKLFFGSERGAGAESFEDVGAIGEGESRVCGLLAFAVRVDEFSEEPDAGLSLCQCVWEREGLEASCFYINGTIFKGASGGWTRFPSTSMRTFFRRYQVSNSCSVRAFPSGASGLQRQLVNL